MIPGLATGCGTARRTAVQLARAVLEAARARSYRCSWVYLLPTHPGMSKVSLDALLADDEWAWLTASATEARLPDEGKAFRCCVNFLAQSQAADVHVAEALSASTTDAASRQPTGDHKPRAVDLAASQIEWMRSASAQSGVSSIESFASTVVQACMKVDDRTAIFGVVRCKTATASRGDGDVAGLADTSTVCAGAQEALAAQKATS